MAGTRWASLASGNLARASDMNANLAWLEGHVVPMQGGSTTTGVFDLGTTTALWRNGFFSAQVVCASISATTIVCASVSATTVRTGTLVLDTAAPSTPSSLNALYSDNIVKAWALISQTTTGNAIIDDYNVGSVSRTAVGRFTITYATAIGATNSAMVASCLLGANQLFAMEDTAITRSTTAISVRTSDHAGADIDSPRTSVVLVGD